MKERVNNYQFKMIKQIYRKNRQKIEQIQNSNLCYGDKARMIVKQKITDNLVYARKLLEFKIN